MLKVETFEPNSSTPGHTVNYEYELGAHLGVEGLSLVSNPYTLEYARRTIETTISQDGQTYTSTASNFDSLEYPQTRTGSSVSGTRTETTAYHHDLDAWVIGQTANVTINGTLAA